MRMRQQQLTIGKWIALPETDEIVSGEQRRRLDHTVMKLLVFLIQNKNRDLSKEEIISEVWGEGVHTEEVLTVAMSSLRKTLDDDFRKPKYIKTIPRFGYHLLDTESISQENGTRPVAVIEALERRVGLRFLIISVILFMILLIALVVLLQFDLR